jgi:hypothetical protein
VKTATLLLAGLSLGFSLGGCSRSKAGAQDHAAVQATVQPGRAVPAPAVLSVPRLKGSLKLDGETLEDDWHADARTHPFTDATGGEARPFSEAHFLWDAENLYVLLYAADNDIRARVTEHDGPVWIDDHFELHLTPAGAVQPTYTFDVSPTGVVMDAKRVPGGKDDASWESGIKLGVDRDGDVNDDSHDDEEWVIEAAIPLRSMGAPGKPGTRFLVDVSRCDTPRHTKEKRCGSWGTPAQPRTIELAP